MSVLVDRMIGLFVLGVLAAAVLLPRTGDARFRAASLIVFLFVGGCFGFGVLFLSRRLRKLVRFEQLLAKLPFSQFFIEVDRGIFVYRDHPKAVWLSLLLSLLNHVAIVSCAVGMGGPWAVSFATSRSSSTSSSCRRAACWRRSPRCLAAGASARAPSPSSSGWPACPGTQSVALSILVGLSQLAWSLIGGWFFLQRPDRVSSKDLASFAKQVGSEVEAPPAQS